QVQLVVRELRIDAAIFQGQGRPEVEILSVHGGTELPQVDVGILDVARELPAARQDRVDQNPRIRQLTTELDQHRLDVAHQVFHGLSGTQVVRADQQENLIWLQLDDRIESLQNIVSRVAAHAEVVNGLVAEPTLPI